MLKAGDNCFRKQNVVLTKSRTSTFFAHQESLTKTDGAFSALFS